MQIKEFQLQILPYKNRLFRTANQVLRNTPEAEDVVQEVFIKLWNKRADLVGIENLEAWSVRVTKNLAIDKLRSRPVPSSPIEESWSVESENADPYEQIESNDTMGHIQKLMSRLPEKQRLVMHLRDIEEYSYQEISEVLEIPMAQVKVYLFRARQSMRNWIEQTQLAH
ncbi:MAG: RNA polymerase sigma factor [Saprospiraceae bacterium]|nr:RNA polymerase sigma factor [Saprospiraceae bacterium]